MYSPLRNTKIGYHAPRIRSLSPLLRKMNPTHNLRTCSFNVHYKISYSDLKTVSADSLKTSAATYQNTRCHILEVVFSSQALRAVFMKGYMFWDVTPCSTLKVNRLALVLPASCWFLLNIGTICCSETVVNSQQTMRRYIPKERTSREVVS
jgi:hypothetical protein